MMAGCGRIISVEDSDTDFIALRFALEAAGVRNPLERCETGRAAVSCLLPNDGRPLSDDVSLVMLDLNLPEVDGRELIKAFRARDPKRHVPLIVLTTSSHPRDIDACYRAGADAYLVKPLDLEEWEAKVGALANFWLRTRQGRTASGDTAAAGPAGAGATLAPATLCSAEVLAQINRAIEREIIPRLLLAHGAKDPSCPPGAGARARPTVGDRVAELARLVLEKDVAIAATYVETIREPGQTLESLFQDLVTPAARLVGDLWKADLCNFAEFTEALLRLQKLLVELSPDGTRETRH